MKTAKQKGISIIPETKRYELKFTIPRNLIEPISRYVSIYCSLDKYSNGENNGFYTISNIYFDTPGYLFLKRKLNGDPDRFNLRIRSYSKTGSAPYFLEIKQKQIEIVKKYRTKISNKDLGAVMSDHYNETEKNNSNSKVYNQFLELIHTYNASPKILTQYRRLAFVSEVDNSSLVTIDCELSYKKQESLSFKINKNNLIPYDYSTLFDTSADVILELKCESLFVPFWMIDLIKTFNLQRRGFSKYTTGVLEVLKLYSHEGRDRCGAEAFTVGGGIGAR